MRLARTEAEASCVMQEMLASADVASPAALAPPSLEQPVAKAASTDLGTPSQLETEFSACLLSVSTPKLTYDAVLYVYAVY